MTRIEGEFRHGLPHGEVTVWYGKDQTRIRVEGTFRMGRIHGHAKVVDVSSGNEKVIYDGKFLNGRPLDVDDDAADRKVEVTTPGQLLQILLIENYQGSYILKS